LSWFWYAWNFERWMVMMGFRTLDMWVPGLIAILLMLEALRKAVNLTIALLVLVVVAYGFVGDRIPGLLTAEVFHPTRTVMYLYADSSGIPGIVVRIIIDLVLPFVIFGKVMEIAGGMTFFNNLALGLMGRRRGGPAKVAVVASGSFGTLSGSTVANIMSTGIITIPLMKRTGFKPEQAGAIEAVSSNGGQIMPPVMGATAFIIAEFLQLPYSQVVAAALAPALLYYLVLFLKIDAIAMREGLKGLDPREIPPIGETLRNGWLFVIPIAILVYLLFWKGFNPGRAAIYVTGLLLVGYLIKLRFRPSFRDMMELMRRTGTEVVPLILIGGGAGAVVGVLNSTGFAFQLSLLLAQIASSYGLLAMLLLTALVSIILGMGMPTAAVYVVLVTVVAPTVIRMGVDPLGAHLFLFYFGLMSMITPPIAVGSIVAAQVAGASIWTTGNYGARLGIAAYLLPFLWIYNPAVMLNGSGLEIVLVLSNCIVAALVLQLSMLRRQLPGVPDGLASLLLTLLAIGLGSATIWLGSDNPMAGVATAAGLAFYLAQRYRAARAQPAAADPGKAA
ncbi:MAG: TRAP transporter fused permease subunit, partial [Rhodobacteraceae bacterium]|nr:TRAP transporter fused permease subunit [Paracoccaceae bacterium]